MPLKSNLGAIAREVEPAIARGVRRSAAMVADLARQLVPVDTGSLRGTIRSADGPGPLNATVAAGDAAAKNTRTGAPVTYARYIEYGTASSAAQPYLTPALKAIKPEREVLAEIRAILRGR